MTVYAARHPAHIRSIVLSGANPIAFDPWGRDSVAAARRAIRLVCARTGDCNGQRVLRDVARLAVRLRARPVAFTIVAGDRRHPARLDEAALAALVFAGGDATAYGRIPAAVASALDGDHALLRRLVESSRLVWEAILAQPSFSFPLNLAVDCHDYPRVFAYADDPPARLAAYEQALAAVDPRAFWPFSPTGWAEGGSAGGTCLEWPDDPTAASPMPAGTPLPDVPVLVLSGDLDANTTSVEGRRTAAQYPRATFVEIPNAGHTPAAWSDCAAALALRFVVTLRAQPGACAGTGEPPPVMDVPALRAAQLPLPQAAATRAERRALAVVVATAADLYEQGGLLEVLGSASALRGGRYVIGPAGSIRLRDARVVRDARISGVVGIAEWLEGDLRLAGPAVPDGRLQVVVREDGSGRASGVLDGRHVELTFVRAVTGSR
jgi:pimeloyl-ACP methyl ester carboxylesterase